ncbi:hypothetical protein [Streptomyces sp. NPDC015131]|uniref:hypothetical protein n=1 Tax=Streptomyces sp. NPDC015131 TaxID=3364941 RepID=UPI0036FF7367
MRIARDKREQSSWRRQIECWRATAGEQHMRDGYIRWYRESAATPVLAAQAEAFAAYGLRLVHPGKGAAVVLDVEGDDVLMSPEELGRLLGLRIASLTVDWWLSADVDVVVEYAYEPLGCEIQTLWLDGLTPEQAGAVEAAVLAAAAALPVPTRAVVVDRKGAGDPREWDSPVLYDGENVPPPPDRLLLGPPVADRLLAALPELRGEPAEAGLTALTRARPA